MTDSNALMATYAPPDILFERGEGSWLITREGDRYLDFISGIAVTAFGHEHPHLVAALKEQTDKYWHSSNMFRVEGAEKLARRLTDNSFADRVFFCNSGAEAVEAGLKMMRRYHYDRGQPHRSRIIGMHNAFHGRTIATIAAAGNPAHTKGFFEGDMGFDHVPFGDIDALQEAVTDKTAGIILEPIQGEGGIMPAPDGYLKAVRDLCSQTGTLFMVDEIQCGMGRTGKLFAHEWDQIKPDILASAKGLGGGFPIGACLATEQVSACMIVGTHGSTFGGNPLATNVGNAVLDLVLAEGFLETVYERGQYLKGALEALVTRHPDKLAGVRGRGLMLGLQTHISNTRLLDCLREAGLLTGRAGSDILRLLPPLNVSTAEIDQALTLMDTVLTDWQSG
ncbi:aspartate aminotransferase family protein [Sneathiella chinensis]|uniref:Acetylornithine aminotransferase n=1 Tax=Sneathiella chinensis TaxID=349750 RepID=A0ABQ5U4N3_9PROT|nr:aspartate aminotransferase family protein [Sneathiella chinensis]GLQ05441.1 acetylornithine aminotransferase [Sneathiella chinensis]